MRKNYHKMTLAMAIAAMSYATPSFAVDYVVETQKSWLSGATHIFGRMSTSGNIVSSVVQKQGFCYSSTNKTPTVDDAYTETYLSNSGKIYNISGLEPSTVYYIRAFVQLKNGDYVYGEPVKAITRPVGGVSYNINDGFPSDALTRIQSAAKEAIDLWNEYTGIRGLHVTINYGASTPTADCSYGGWMRVGPNASYQRTGTLLHEMLHAIGVGTIGTWQNSFMRENTTRGYWLGVRATRALRFWDNSTTSRLNGDGTHMWPYGVNGAHEDAGTQVLYIGNSVLAEALGEDGLAPTSGQFATPAYVFEQDDDTKYYLKNEEYGTDAKYLRIDKSGNLKWEAMDADAATANDSAAWNVTFDPVTCYYSFKNVASGRYITYNSGMKTKVAETVTASERFHLLPSPVEVAELNGEKRTGYWIGNVTNNSMSCLTLSGSKFTNVSSGVLNFSKEAGHQRWMILTANEAKELTSYLRADKASETLKKLEKMEALLNVPHRELTEGADATFAAAIQGYKTQAATASVDDLATIETQAVKDVKTFLGGVNATSAEEPFDISFLIQNASIDAADGWSEAPTSISYSCGEFYQKANFEFIQKITSMPIGVYQLKVQAFQRPGAVADVFTDYENGTDKVDAYIYLSTVNSKQTICNIMKDAQESKLGVGSESEVGNKFVPNDMQSASKYFAKGLYENSVKATTTRRSTLYLGMKAASTGAVTGYWTIFDNFRLYYYGAEEPTTGITEVKAEKTVSQPGVYNLGGQLVRSNAQSLEGLPQGIYIVNGKKVVVK